MIKLNFVSGEMDSKERVLTALAHKKPDRVPFNFWMDRRLMDKYEQRIGHRYWRVTHYGADVIETFAHLDFPEGPHIEREGSAWQTGPYLQSWDDVDDVPMPDANDEKVYETIKADIEEFSDKAIFLNMTTAWGVISKIRTYELIYTDMYEYGEEFKKLSRRILDVQKVMVERACKMGITALYLMGDLATSKGLSMSPVMIEEFCFAYARELVEIAHSYDKAVLFHSDGMVMELIEPLLGLGVCAMNPLQPNVNDAAEFKRRFGERMAAYGGLDNCFIIPDGSTDDVRNHVLEAFETLGKPDGGLIFSIYDIPLHTPDANVETMVNTIKHQCIY